MDRFLIIINKKKKPKVNVYVTVASAYREHLVSTNIFTSVAERNALFNSQIAR